MAKNIALAPHSPAEPDLTGSDTPRDYLIRRNGIVHAGTHLLIDFWGATALDEIDTIERAFREAVDACGATLLHIHLHEFNENGGISGVAVLAESHISVHTWPEIGYAAFDVFMCGDCDPHKAVPVLRRTFLPQREAVDEQIRGVVAEEFVE